MEQDKLFTRQGEHDLIYRHHTTLEKVIKCEPVELTTLDDRNLLIPID